MAEKNVSNQVVLFHRKEALNEVCGLMTFIPVLEIDANDRFQRPGLMGRCRTIGLCIHPIRRLSSLHDFSMMVRHVVFPQVELAKGNEPERRCLARRTKKATNDPDSSHTLSC
jgi:hypothetical protein